MEIRYFTENAGRNIHAGMRIGIDGPMTPITDRTNSHKGSWSRILENQFRTAGYQHVEVVNPKKSKQDDAWKNYDVLVIEHGMEFKGQTFNLFGGLTNDVVNRLWRMCQFPGIILSADQPMPDIAEFVRKRKENEDHWNKQGLMQSLHEMRKRVDYFDRIYPSTGLVIGDSHSLSVYVPGYEICRNDGKTMYNVSRGGIVDQLAAQRDIKYLRIYFGNIDIRHHLMRQPDPGQATADLVLNYFQMINAAKVAREIYQVEVVAPLWIEDESRKLPKTGYYQDTPFFGTWEQRNWLRDYMTTLMKYYGEHFGFKIIEWPTTMLEADGKLSFNCMEGTQSVHLGRDWYRYDLETSQPNGRFS